MRSRLFRERDPFAGPFVPDTTVADEVAERCRPALSPTHKLMFAVLEDAIHVYRTGGGPSRDGGGPKLLEKTTAWFASEDEAWPFSFVSICDALGVDPRFLRARLAEWRLRQGAQPSRGVRRDHGRRGQMRVSAVSYADIPGGRKGTVYSGRTVVPMPPAGLRP